LRALLQRVHEASVTVPGEAGPEVTGSIGRGLVALVGVTHDDGEDEARRLADKIHRLRLFDDADGVMNLSAEEVGAEVLVVSQFTLYGDTRKGRRPSWLKAAPPEHAEPLVEVVAARLRELGAPVATGRFQAHMDVALINDGPVTLMIEV
jgi:D-aminoacyl-tRNA deacylase